MSEVSIATNLPSPERAHIPWPARPEDASTRRRSPFPVGARFPRRSPAEVFAYRATSTTAPAAARVFPAGARFPRRTRSDVLAYLANVELSRPAPVRRSHPVGARFPRLPR